MTRGTKLVPLTGRHMYRVSVQPQGRSGLGTRKGGLAPQRRTAASNSQNAACYNRLRQASFQGWGKPSHFH
ncbi:MAG: hypothetical protein KME46_00265 [Brasilonema angustatum HA4187-MV1]|jgi:hypothetical protein|nr:hypothetical protein [Brasilonema angustatum HA4187-MV1]